MAAKVDLVADGVRQAITLTVRRGTRDLHQNVDYQLPREEGQSILAALRYVYENIDRTLSFQYSCRIGLCTSCMVRANGKAVRACTEMVVDGMLIEPYKDNVMERDLTSQLPQRNACLQIAVLARSDRFSAGYWDRETDT